MEPMEPDLFILLFIYLFLFNDTFMLGLLQERERRKDAGGLRRDLRAKTTQEKERGTGRG